LRALATPGFRRTFDLAPSLLHHNHPDLPGYLAGPDPPRGVLFYDLWLQRSQIAEEGPWEGAQPPLNPVVESLVLIGSSGSVGHTSHSDLDYWVCYNPERLNGERLGLFLEKLAAISKWAMEENGTEANFYPVDLSRLAQGNLNSLSEERDGEVAPLLLMEELYRTILYVAGRIPLWCVWPVAGPEAEYRQAVQELAPLGWVDQPPLYVDLGFPSKPQPQEYLASAMWLTCKSEDDPFKGLLKIMPILEAVQTEFTAPLLCDQVKELIFNNPDSDNPVDPYVVTVERVIAFVSQSLAPDQLDLVEEAAVLKILGHSSDFQISLEPGQTDPKSRALVKWIKEWNWPPEKLRRLRNYENWPNSEQLAQARELIKLLFSCYMLIANTLMTHFPGQVDAQNEVLAPMAARILGRLGGAEVTVELLPSHILRQHLSGHKRFSREGGGWSVRDLTLGIAGLEDKSVIYQSLRAAKAAAWLVANQIYSPAMTVSVAEKDQEALSDELLLEYLAKLAELFPPIKFHTLNPQTLWQAQAQGPVLVTFNFEEPTTARVIRTMDVIYRTGWGETRHQFKDVSELAVEADKLFVLSQLLYEARGVSTTAPLIFLAGAQPQMIRAFNNLQGAINTRFRSMSSGPVKSLIDL
jgi:adenylate cyclase class 1